MKLKLALLVAIIFIGTMILSFRSTSVTNQQLSDTIYSREWATLSERAQNAREQGKKRVVFPAPVGIPRHLESLSEAFSDYRVLVVEPLTQKSYAQANMDIVTWHKFKIVEELSQENTFNASDGNLIDDLPKEIAEVLLPVEEGEILVPQAGGILNLDGITLIQETDQFPLLSMNQKYLLFVSKDSSKKIGRMDLGPNGIFEITQDNLLNPLITRRHPINRDMERYYGRSLSNLRAHLSRRNSKK